MGVLKGSKPRAEVLAGDLDDAIFAADFGKVIAGEAPKVYQDAKTFFQNTHPAEPLKKVVKDVFERLANPKENGATIRLSTGFGGGKTHTLLTLWHLGRNIGDSSLGSDLLPAAGRPKSVRVVAIDCEKAGTTTFLRHEKGTVYRLASKGETLVRIDATPLPPRVLSPEFLSEQLNKCDRKLETADYDGAITNARSIVEAVLIEIEGRLDSTPTAYDGDLGKLYKRVQKRLNIDPAQAGLTDALRQILSGLTSIVAGLGALRNKAGDAHARAFRPERHHAVLAANAAKSLVDFLFATFEYQKRSGRIADLPPSGRAS